MKLSIITINYNNCEGLRKTIESVVNQTWKEFEWIIVDGGSTDGSRELIEETAKSCINISYWCSESDKGVYNAMNKGISHTCGDYLCFLNSGDIFYESCTLEHVFYSELIADVVYGDWMRVFPNGETTIAHSPQKITIPLLFQDNCICHQAMFIKGTILKEEGYDEHYKILADWARWLKMACQGKSFQRLPIIICQFMIGGLCCSDTPQKKKEVEMVRLSVGPQWHQTLNSFMEQKNNLDKYEDCEITREALLLINERPIFCKLLHLSVIGVKGLRKVLGRK